MILAQGLALNMGVVPKLYLAALDTIPHQSLSLGFFDKAAGLGSFPYPVDLCPVLTVSPALAILPTLGPRKPWH